MLKTKTKLAVHDNGSHEFKWFYNRFLSKSIKTRIFVKSGHTGTCFLTQKFSECFFKIMNVNISIEIQKWIAALLSTHIGRHGEKRQRRRSLFVLSIKLLLGAIYSATSEKENLIYFSLY